MRTTTALLAVGILVTSSAQAQVANMPAHVRQRLAEVGPGWGKDIGGNIEKTLEVYTPLLAVAPKAGIVRARSPITHVAAATPLPALIVIAEYDNPDLDTQGALLFGALCERDRSCPRFTRMEWHNHLSMVYQFNTVDEALGSQILDFIRHGR